MKVLTINCGSSSLKYRLFGVNPPSSPPNELARGEVAGIGAGGEITLMAGSSGQVRLPQSVPDHATAVAYILDQLAQSRLLDDPPLSAVGHRVVHGGHRFIEATRIDEAVIEEIDAVSALAPLHNHPALAAIRASRAALGGTIPMVAVFDTAYFADLPAYAAHYAIPRELTAKHRIRRFGFHGLAHQSMVRQYLAQSSRTPVQARLITLQLGSGCSVAAIDRGQPIDTSMGFTPLEGLMMATRSGDLDPALPGYLSQAEGVSIQVIESWLNQRSGLLGVSGRSADLRQVLEAEAAGDTDAALAIAMFCHRVRKYVGAYLAALGGADAILFGGGIGENAPTIRARVCAALAWCGLHLDEKANAAPPREGGRITQGDSAIHAYVIRVDEEIAVLEETLRCLAGKSGSTDRQTAEKVDTWDKQ